MKKLIIPFLVILFAFSVIGFNYNLFESSPSIKNENKFDLNNNIQNENEQVVIMKMVRGKYYFKPDTIKANIPVVIKNDGSLRGCGVFVKQPQLGLDMNFGMKNEYRFTPKKKGTFKFSCSMAMFDGELKII